MLSIEIGPFPILTTDRLVLRQLRPSDAEEVFRMRSDPRVMQHVPRPLAQDIAHAHELIDRITRTVAANDAVQWAITVKGEEAFIGLIGFWRIEKENHLAELGYTLMPDHWGQGLMSEAIATVVHFGFDVLHLHKVLAITRPGNVASIKVLEKNGFIREAHIREDILWNGVFLDSVYFGRLVR